LIAYHLGALAVVDSLSGSVPAKST
jgi:hypothetical protein